MNEYKTVLFEPRLRVKMLEELVYPSIFRSSWQEEEKIRALFRHKLRVAESIKGIGDAEEREELCNALNALYSYYLALIGCSSSEVEKGESAVKEEFKRIEIEVKAYIPAQSESAEEVTASVRWIKARLGMVWAQLVKNASMHHPFTEDELDKFKKDLNRIELKLSEQPNSQAKVDIGEEIKRLRELLLSE
ncbi:MAG: hypothetical protein QMD22_00870 [archaeon]|nr:hypothetical protein [archaeon]